MQNRHFSIFSMAKIKRLTIQCSRCRRAGEKLFLKGEKCFIAKCPLTRRNYPPGMHGGKVQRKGTGYSGQLQEKQKAKWVYGLREAQFRNYVFKAVKKKGNTAQNLLQMLERRLDNVIYRLGLAKSRQAARQLVSHGHFLINNQKVNIPSFQVKPNETITWREKSKKSKFFADLPQILAKYEPPAWLSLDKQNLTAKVLGLPQEGDLLQMNFDPKKIIEFYSR